MEVTLRNSDSMNWPTILLIGDSLTQQGYSTSGKWVALLADLFQRKCDIINRGFSGYTTRSIKSFVPSIVSEELVRSNVATIIYLGANDSNLKDLNALQHVPLEEYKSNLQKIVNVVCTKGIPLSKILLVPPPPCNEEMWRKTLEQKTNGVVARSPKNNKHTRLYFDACLEIAGQLNCRKLTNANEYWDSLNSAENFCDGLHFSEQGSAKVFEFVSKELMDMTEKLPMILPDWKDLPVEDKNDL